MKTVIAVGRIDKANPQPLKDGHPRCVHDMRPEWCAECLIDDAKRSKPND